MRKIIVLVVLFLLTFLIYLNFIDKKVYYVAMGDGLSLGVSLYGTKDIGYADYVKNYLEENDLLEEYVNIADETKRITDVINDIESNKKVNINGKSRTIKNFLIKADVITLTIGINDLLTHLVATEYVNDDALYAYVDEMMEELAKLFKIMREYCKEDIIVIGYYNPYSSLEAEELFEYLNNRYSQVAKNYNIHYLDVYHILKGKNYFSNHSIYPNKDGYKVIGDNIIELFSKTLLK